MSNFIKGSLEAIYTTQPLSKFLCDKVKENFKETITEIVEPCAGVADIAKSTLKNNR